MEKLSFKIAEFEGPLDLLLFLISKHKIDIYDIEISELLKQYLDYLDSVKEQNLEVASEFLEMAARLVHIKSVMLLPKNEEAETLKQELTGQLLEYQACKEIAQQLKILTTGANIFIREPVSLPVDKEYVRVHNKNELLKAYMMAMGKSMRKLPPPAEAFSGIVSRRIVSVSSKIVYILKRMYRESKIKFDHLFNDSKDRSDLVATFLAVLELVKSKRISISETDEISFNNRKAEK